MPPLTGLQEGEELVALIAVRFSAGMPSSLDDVPKPGLHRPSVVRRYAYAHWATSASAAGFPIAGPEMILGITQERLLVWKPAFIRTQPRRFAGAIPLARIQTAGVYRRMFASVLTLMLEKGTFVGVETFRATRLRRFAAGIPSYTEYKAR